MELGSPPSPGLVVKGNWAPHPALNPSLAGGDRSESGAPDCTGRKWRA